MRINGNRMKHHSVLVPFLILGLASCATGPDYKRPDVSSPDRFKSAVPEESAQPNLGLDWWTLFGDPDLNALEKEALQANQSLQAAMARVAQARASARSVKSEFFPVVTMSPSATRSRMAGSDTSESAEEKLQQATEVVNKVTNLVQKIGALSQSAASGTSTSGTSSGTSTSTVASTSSSSGIGSLLSSAASSSSQEVSPISNSYRIPFDLSYEIDIWGRVRRSYESARAQVRASEYDLEVVRQTLLADVAQNYFNIRSLDEQEEILDRNLAAYQEQVDLTSNKYNAGL
ncbi:MAG: TolC family protein, partial [Candidatus Hydrogenedentes bacterium]|nr:TolC family protein [Candidatus Hydrogenedentota bacterium]